MRILHVNKFLYRRGGAEAYMEDVSALQAEAGHDVSFFGMAHPKNTHNEWSEYYPKEIEFDPLPSGLASRGRTAVHMLWSRSARDGMTQVVRSFKPDVVHFHNIYHHLSPSVIGPARSAGAATVLTLHDYKLACPSYLFMSNGEICEACLSGRFRNAVSQRCKGGSLAASALLAVETGLHRRTHAYGGIQTLICPSRFMRDKMTQAGVYPERLQVVPSFVPLPAETVGPISGGPVVYAGRLSPEKGADVAVEAMAELPEAVLCIAGEGPEMPRLRKIAERVGPDRVKFLGRIEKAQVADLIAQASAVVVPSRCYENMPLTVLEAMGAGIPVVGSALGGIAELVTSGVNGQLVAPDDPAALAAGLRKVIGDPATARLIGRRGREMVAESYSPERHITHLTEVYERAIGEITVAS